MAKGKQVTYFQVEGGAVLGVLAERDPDYERSLDRAGVNWKVDTTDATDVPVDKDTQVPTIDLQKARVRGGKLEVDR